MYQDTRKTQRALAQEMLDLHERATAWTLERNREAEKQVGAAFGATRSGMEMTRDACLAMGRTWLDAVLPEAAERA